MGGSFSIDQSPSEIMPIILSDNSFTKRIKLKYKIPGQIIGNIKAWRLGDKGDMISDCRMDAVNLQHILLSRTLRINLSQQCIC